MHRRKPKETGCCQTHQNRRKRGVRPHIGGRHGVAVWGQPANRFTHRRRPPRQSGLAYDIEQIEQVTPIRKVSFCHNFRRRRCPVLLTALPFTKPTGYYCNLGSRSTYQAISEGGPRCMHRCNAKSLYEGFYNAVDDQLIVLHLDGPATVHRGIPKGEDSRLIPPGGMTMMPGGMDFRVRLGEPLHTLHLYLRRALLEEVAGTMLAGDPSHIEILPCFGDSDPLIESRCSGCATLCTTRFRQPLMLTILLARLQPNWFSGIPRRHLPGAPEIRLGA